MLIAVAFVAGAVVGALAVGAPFSPVGPKAVILVHVENPGTGDLNARIDVRDAGGKLVVSTTFRVAAHTTNEKTVVNLQAGSYVVSGTFTQGGATASGQVSVNTRSCPDGTVPLASFTVDGSRGASMSAPPSGGCRS